MVFLVNPKHYNPKMLSFPKRFNVQMKQEQSLNESSLNDTPKPLDPVVKQLEKDTTVEELGNPTKPMIGEGFKVHGGKIPVKNTKLRKFISLKL